MSTTKPKTYVGTKCIECGRGPMISKHQGAMQLGIVHGAGGRCRACYGRARWQARNPEAKTYATVLTTPATAEDEARHAHTMRALESYVAGRRRRGVPVDGRKYMRVTR